MLKHKGCCTKSNRRDLTFTFDRTHLFSSAYRLRIYCDREEVDEDKIIPLNLIKTIRRCEKHNYGFLCYGDFNAHSHLWYSETDNKRGKIYERHLVAEYSLNVLNNNTRMCGLSPY